MKNVKDRSTEQARLSTADLSAGIRHLEQGRVKSKCEYCGSPDATERDHVVPCSWRGYRDYRDGTVPCCRQCNVILSDAPVFNVQDRAEYILNSMVSKPKYKRIMNFPQWNDDELSEMSEEFSKSIKAGIMLKDDMRLRVEHLIKVANKDYYETGSSIDDNLCRQIVFEYAHTKGRPRSVIDSIAVELQVGYDDIRGVTHDKKGDTSWIVLKTIYSMDINTPNWKCRLNILKMKGSRISQSLSALKISI